MAITTTLQRRFTIQKAFIVVLCLVMGVWGLYDYLVKIPRRERVFERGQICFKVKEALGSEPDREARPIIDEATATVDGELQRLFQLGIEDAQETGATPTVQDAAAALRERNEETWIKVLALFRVSLQEANQRITTAAPGSPLYQQAYDIAERAVDETEGITRPNKLDRATQWLFILCLPFAPITVWQWLVARRRVYRLDEDGTLSGPEGAWTREEIADIDMSRWMAKSVAFVVHRDGARMKLDDYVYKNVDLIAGAIASERYPDDWTAKGREFGADDGDGEEDAGALDVETGEAEEVEAGRSSGG